MGLIQRTAGRLLAKLAGEEWYEPSTYNVDSVGLGRVITKADINTMIVDAAGGDVRPFSAFKREMVAADAHLSGEVDKAKAFLTQAPLEIMAWPPSVNRWGARETAESRRARDVASYAHDQLLDPDVSIQRAIEHAFWGLLDGVAGFQQIVKPGPSGRWKLVRLDAIEDGRFRWHPTTGVLGVQPGEDSSELVPVADLGMRLVTVVADPQVRRRDRAGILRRCVAPWFTARNGREWWARDVETFASPFRYAKYKRGDKEAPAKLNEAMRAMGNLGFAAFPDDVDLQFLKGFDVAGKGQGELVGYNERSMSKAVLGSTQTADVQVGAGSKASAGVHFDIVETFVDAYGRRICEVLREQVIKPLVAISFGSDIAEQFTPVPILRVRRYDDLKTFWEAMETAGKAGAKGIPLSYVRSRTGMPEAEEGEPTLQPPSASPAPTPDPGTDRTNPGPSGDGEDEPREPEGHAARRPAGPPLEAAQLAQLEAWAVEGVESAGKALLAPYAALIAEVKRDGGDLGHLAARVRLQAQMAGEGKAKTADLVARVIAHALLTGWAHEVGIEPPKAP
jgi:phage gp29-like protein